MTDDFYVPSPEGPDTGHNELPGIEVPSPQWPGDQGSGGGNPGPSGPNLWPGFWAPSSSTQQTSLRTDVRTFRERHAPGTLFVFMAAATVAAAAIGLAIAGTTLGGGALFVLVMAGSLVFPTACFAALKSKTPPTKAFQPRDVRVVSTVLQGRNIAAGTKTQQIIYYALTQLKRPYLLRSERLKSKREGRLGTVGGPGKAFDCSLLVAWAGTQAGIQGFSDSSTAETIRNSDALDPIPVNGPPQRGDLVFFYDPNDGSEATHVGICLGNINGNIKYISATKTRGVKIYPINTKRFGTYMQARHFQ